MKIGFTTGSCAAAAAKAGAYMLLSGRVKENITITTPKGIDFKATILDIRRGDRSVSCAVRKDGGDDPDVTTGAMITATVSYLDTDQPVIIIEGGSGVGTVTKPGLDQKVGNAAINSVPRNMIEHEVREIMDIFDCREGIKVTISVPCGEEIAQKTFNPRLGIEGGISILGTSGVVEPMSTQALLDTIYIEMKQKKELGASVLVVSPGNYGLDFMRDTYGYDLDKAVKISNYIGASIDMAAELGYERMLITGHIGKLIKVSGGIMNTHSKEADCRMELLAAAAIRCGADAKSAEEILDCVTCEAAYRILTAQKIDKACMEYIINRIYTNLNRRAADKMQIECIVYSNDFGMLGATAHAEELLEASMKECKDEN